MYPPPLTHTPDPGFTATRLPWIATRRLQRSAARRQPRSAPCSCPSRPRGRWRGVPQPALVEVHGVAGVEDAGLAGPGQQPGLAQLLIGDAEGGGIVWCVVCGWLLAVCRYRVPPAAVGRRLGVGPSPVVVMGLLPLLGGAVGFQRRSAAGVTAPGSPGRVGCERPLPAGGCGGGPQVVAWQPMDARLPGWVKSSTVDGPAVARRTRVRHRTRRTNCRLVHVAGRPVFVPCGSNGASTTHWASARSARPVRWLRGLRCRS